ncbi:MAG: polysaccharide deacetylase family protein [Pseudomonadota bacterium]|nr:polysaccharide deacetylase family protein [Pseudomonadota bacterium]
MVPSRREGKILSQYNEASSKPTTWPNGAGLALSIVVNVEEGAEQSIRDGDSRPEPIDELGVVLRKPLRNYANESNYRYGIKAGAPRVLALLKSRSVPATFTCAALSLERSPKLAAEIIGNGHEVCAHGLRWTHQHRMNESEERSFIDATSQSILETCGERPLGWLSRYLITDNTRRLLADAGFVYHMDDYSDDQPFWDTTGDKSILVLPYALDTNDMKMWTAPSYSPSDWLRYAIDTFDWLYAESAQHLRMMSLGVHLRIIGRPGRIHAFEKFLDHVTAHQNVWIARRIDIARHWIGATEDNKK